MPENQRVFKKVSTPFENFKPTSAILMINAVDPQINTFKVFIEAIEDKKLKCLVVVNKYEKFPRGKIFFAQISAIFSIDKSAQLVFMQK